MSPGRPYRVKPTEMNNVYLYCHTKHFHPCVKDSLAIFFQSETLLFADPHKAREHPSISRCDVSAKFPQINCACIVKNRISVDISSYGLNDLRNMFLTSSSINKTSTLEQFLHKRSDRYNTSIQRHYTTTPSNINQATQSS